MALRINSQAGHPSTLWIKMVPGTLAVSMDCPVEIDEDTRAVLGDLGWTPPPAVES